MKNVSKVREGLLQIQAACVEICKGCEQAQHQEVSDEELDYLVMACLELHKTATRIRFSGDDADSTEKTEPSNDRPEPLIPSPREAMIEEHLTNLRACGYDASFHEKTGQIRIFLNGHYFKVAGGTAPHPTLIEVPVTEL